MAFSSSPPPSVYDFLIVGAGIAGLAAATRLSRGGHKVCVLEQAPALEEVGAGLSIWGAGLAAMAQLGLADKLAANAMVWQHYEMWIGNKCAITRPTSALALEDGIAPLILTRAHLHQTLLGAVPTNIDIVLNAEVTALREEADRVQINTRGGDVYQARYVIGADGQSSKTRAALGDAKPLDYSGYVCYRGLAENNTGLSPHQGMEFFGAGTRVGLFALPSDQLYWFAFTNSKVRSVPITEVLPLFQSLHPMADSLFSNLDLSTVIENPIQHRKPFKPKKGWPQRAVLVGDAAHPNQPSLGMGASVALADVMLLCDLMGEDKGKDVPGAIARYYKQSMPAWRSMHRRHNQLGTLGQGLGKAGQHMLAWSIRLTTKG